MSTVTNGKHQWLHLQLPELVEELRTSYWFVPLVLSVSAAALAFLLLLVDARLEISPPSAFWIVFPTSPEGGRALLSAIIGSMITATSVTFSVTVVALTVAAEHFGPRVLANFIRHASAQVVLGTFIGTFVYAVLVMGSIRGTAESGNVPQLSVIGAVALVIVCVGALIYYVHHVSTALQVGRIASEIAAELERSLSRVASASTERLAMPAVPSDAAALPARASGYVQRIDHAALVQLARAAGARIWIARPPGTFAIARTPLVHIAPPGAASDAVTRAANDACIIGVDRTTWQDPEFALKQLVEIALRALSPGVNEPFTALTCIDRMAQALAYAAAADAPCAVWVDDDGTPRVFGEQQPFEVLVRSAFDPVRIFAGPNPAIAGRLLDAIADVGALTTRPEHIRVLRHQADLLRESAASHVAPGDDRMFVESRFRDAARKLGTTAVAFALALAAATLSACAHAQPSVVAGRVQGTDDERRTALITAIDDAIGIAAALGHRPPGETATGRRYAPAIVLITIDELDRLQRELNALRTAAASDRDFVAEQQTLAAHMRAACDAAAALTTPDGDDPPPALNVDGTTVARLRHDIDAIAASVGVIPCVASPGT